MLFHLEIVSYDHSSNQWLHRMLSFILSFIISQVSVMNSILINLQLYGTIFTGVKKGNRHIMSFSAKIKEKLRFLRNIGTGGGLRPFLKA